MKTAWIVAAARSIPGGWPWTLPRVVVLIAALGTIAYGAQIPIFVDDFASYPRGSNPTTPPVGEPWQVSETFPDGIMVNGGLMFGPDRNTALAPFSAASRQLFATYRNATVSFDYYGMTRESVSQYFDVGGYDPLTGDPAFFVRMSRGPGGLYDVLYLDPGAGLVDSGIDVVNNRRQSVTIAVDCINQTYQLDVQGNSATLPMFTCPDEIVGVEFSNQFLAASSGIVQNLNVTVTVPEVATAWMVLTGLAVLIGVWTARRCAA